MKSIYLMAAVAVCAAAMALQAQDKPKDGQGRRPGHPLVAALDADKDGSIDASEISNAPAALRKLDKNGDGKLTREELRPARADGKQPNDADRAERRRNKKANSEK